MPQYSPLYPERPFTVRELFTVHYFEYASGYAFHGETHDFWELLYVDRGAIHVTAGEHVYELHQGQLIFHAPGEFHALSSDGAPPDLIVMSFSCEGADMSRFRGLVTQAGRAERMLLARIVSESGSAFSTPLDDPATRGMDRRGEEELFGSEQMLQNVLERLLLTLLRRRGGERPVLSTARAALEAEDLLGRVVLYLQAHCREQLSLERICRENLVGRSRLQKLFHTHLGCGVIAYFRRLKAEAAKEALRKGGQNMEEIADALGYTSAAYFSRDFKKCTGMTPTEYSTSAKLRTARSKDEDNYR